MQRRHQCAVILQIFVCKYSYRWTRIDHCREIGINYSALHDEWCFNHDTKIKTYLVRVLILAALTRIFSKIIFSSNHTWIFSWGFTRTIREFSTTSGEVSHNFAFPTFFFYCLALGCMLLRSIPPPNASANWSASFGLFLRSVHSFLHCLFVHVNNKYVIGQTTCLSVVLALCSKAIQGIPELLKALSILLLSREEKKSVQSSIPFRNETLLTLMQNRKGNSGNLCRRKFI